MNEAMIPPENRNTYGKRFLQALGVTEQSVDIATYRSLINDPKLNDLFKNVVREKLEHLGFSMKLIQSVPMPLSHPKLREAMLRLVEAHTQAYGGDYAKIITECLKSPVVDTRNFLTPLVNHHLEEFAEFLNYAGECRRKRKESEAYPGMEEWAVNASHSLLATFGAMETITNICKIADPEHPHPMLKKFRGGEIMPVMAAEKDANGLSRAH